MQGHGPVAWPRVPARCARRAWARGHRDRGMEVAQLLRARRRLLNREVFIESSGRQQGGIGKGGGWRGSPERAVHGGGRR
jgi:hypothetical protein